MLISHSDCSAVFDDAPLLQLYRLPNGARIRVHWYIRVDPELELPGYGSEDLFQELDTVEHCWECMAELLGGDLTDDIICDIGMPVIHSCACNCLVGGGRFSCRVFLLNRKILFIRRRLSIADDGNYRHHWPAHSFLWKRCSYFQ
ncbi:hypothetical protein ABBQ32_009160, partial [Trebouxia sp. C0010 RCD-2024]